MRFFDVSIIGGGVIGLAIARETARRGHKVVLLEKNKFLACGASSGNAGLAHSGYDAPKGSLESRLMRRSLMYQDNLFKSFGLDFSEHVRNCGSLIVAWNDEDYRKLTDVVMKEMYEAGDFDARLVGKDELFQIEPGLNKKAQGAVFCPYEVVVEPFLIPVGYAESAMRFGAEIRTDWEVIAVEDHVLHSKSGDSVVAKTVINCGGLFSDEIESFRHSSPNRDFTIEPRKGQYAFLSKVPGHRQNHIIEPIATQFSKGVIVWQTLYGDLIVGPTAEPQKSKEDRSVDVETLEMLRRRASEVFPCLQEGKIESGHAGLRTATQHRDYQIRSFKDDNWITVAGIRSTGLSAAFGIAQFVAGLLEGSSTRESEDLPSVSAAKALQLSAGDQRLPPVQSIENLRKSFDGETVEIYGKRWQVTHPITKHGLK